MHVSDPLPSPTTLSGHASRFLERFGHMMSRVILSALYFVLVAPPGIVYRLLCDPLFVKKRPASNWIPWKSANNSVDAARRQA